MKLRRLLVLGLVTLGILLAIVFPSLSQSPTPTSPPAPSIPGKIRVVTRIVPPFVVQEGDQLSGFSMELWKQIAATLKTDYEIKTVPNVAAILKEVENKTADVGIAAISVTSDRERKLDFSQPIFDAGLQILVKSQGTQSPVSTLISSLFSPAMLQLLGLMLVIVWVPAHLIWWVERKHEGGFLENSSYFPGIFKTLWWSAATLATQADEMPKGVWGRVLAVLWMFISVVFVAYFTATVTTALTVQQLQGSIQGPDDLPGKRVATIVNSTSAAYLKDKNIRAVDFPQINDAFQALEANMMDAVVFDSPILMYYAAHEGKGKVEVVGNVFRKESYGIAMPTGSPLRKTINKALLSLQEDGTYDEIYAKWFQ